MRHKLSRVWIPAVTLWFLLFFPFQIVRAQEVEDIQFLESRELALALPAGQESVSFDVGIINSSAEPLDITLQLERLSNEEFTVLPPEAVEALPQTEEQVKPGQQHTFRAAFNRVNDLSGTYTGELVAVANNGSIARLPVKLVVQADPAPAREVFDQGVDPTYLEEISRQSVNLLPSPFAPWGLSLVMPIYIDTSASYDTAQPLVGQLASDSGPIGMVRHNGRQLVIMDLQRAGKYSGKVDLLPDQDGGEIKLNVTIHDHPLYAILVLACGLILAYWLENMVRVERPQRRLKTRLDQLKARAKEIQDDFMNKHRADWPKEWGFFKIYEPEAHENTSGGQKSSSPALLDREANNIQKKFREADGDAERKKWAPDGEEVLKLEGYLDQLTDMNGRASAIHELYQALKGEIPNIDELPLGQQVFGVMAVKEVFREEQEFKKTQDALKEAGEFVKEFYTMYFRLKNLEKIALGDDKVKVQDWLKAFQTAAVANIKVINEFEEDANELVTTIKTAYAPKSRSISVSTKDSFSLQPQLQLLSQPPTPQDIITERPEETVRKLNDLEWRYRVVSGLVVLGTGFYTVYLSNNTFGSVYDYINIFLWGTAITAGFQIARSLFPSLTSS